MAFVLATIVLASTSLGLAARAGILDEASKEVRAPAKDSPPISHDDSCDDPGNFWIIQALWDLTVAPLFECLSPAGYWERTIDVYGNVSYVRWYALPVWDSQFAPFPYSEGAPSIVVAREEEPVTNSRGFSARVAFDYGHNFDHLQRFGGSATIELYSGLAIDAEGHSYHEETPAGCDHLSVGDVNLLWRYVETERSVWRLGFGMNWFADGTHSDTGGNLTLRTDFFPARPVILSGQLDLGSLGGATQFHGRFTAGINIRQYELFIGYDYRSIGSAELQGPLAGLQLWF